MNGCSLNPECPLAPGTPCEATLPLARESKCIDCPRILQYELVQLFAMPTEATA